MFDFLTGRDVATAPPQRNGFDTRQALCRIYLRQRHDRGLAQTF
jgi:hypothetical protein